MHKMMRAWREGLSLSLAVLLTALINHFWIAKEEVWVLMAMIAMMLATRGKTFRVGVIYGLMMMAAVALAGFLSLDRAIGVYIVLPVLFYIAGNMIAPITYLFLLMFILSFLTPSSSFVLLQDRLMNVGLGSLLGYLASQCILPVNLAKQFRYGLQPTLGGLREYMRAVAARIKEYHQPDRRVDVATSRVELMFAGGQSHYPEWVYDAGFNPGLRVGFRFFLIRVERLMELLMSLNCIAERIHYHQLPHQILTQFDCCMQTNDLLLNEILGFIQNGECCSAPDIDYQDDIVRLESDMTAVLPASLELMDISEQYTEIAALFYAVRDVRKTLLQMMLAIDSQQFNQSGEIV